MKYINIHIISIALIVSGCASEPYLKENVFAGQILIGNIHAGGGGVICRFPVENNFTNSLMLATAPSEVHCVIMRNSHVLFNINADMESGKTVIVATDMQTRTMHRIVIDNDDKVSSSIIQGTKKSE